MPAAGWTALRLAIVTIEPPVAGAHGPARVLHGEEHARQAQVDDPLPVGHVVVDDGRQVAGARVGHRDVEPAEPVDGRGHERSLVLLDGDVAGGGDEAVAELVLQGGQSRLVEVAADDRRALGHEAPCDGPADARGRPRDDRHLAVEPSPGMRDWCSHAGAFVDS